MENQNIEIHPVEHNRQTDKRKRILLLLILLCVLSVFLIIFSISKKTPNNKDSIPENRTLQSVKAAPEVFFNTYQNETTHPSLPEKTLVYMLKTSFSETEIQKFASLFNIQKKYKDQNEFVIFSETQNPSTRGILVFNKNTGAFWYQSYGILRSQQSVVSNNPLAIAKETIASFGFDDDISCEIQFRRKHVDKTTFVECHRDWEKAGLPILNPAGVLNIPPSVRLDDLKLADVSFANIKDTSIYELRKLNQKTNKIEVNIQEEGKARPIDFNTITVSIADDGRILAIESNMKWVEKKDLITQNEYVLPNEALESFSKHTSVFSLTNPLGTGVLEWERLYPRDKAYGQQAKIQDFKLVYLETNSAQKYLVPMYIIRGTSTLYSGYAVSFIEALPALKNNTSFLSHSSLSTAVAAATAAPNLQLDTFTPTNPITPSPTASPIPLSITPSPVPSLVDQTPIPPSPTSPASSIPTLTSPPATTSTRCPGMDSSEVEKSTITVLGLGEIVVLRGAPFENIPKPWPHTLFLKSATFPYGDIEEIREIFYKTMEDQYLIHIARAILAQNINFQATPKSSVEEMYGLMGTLYSANLSRRGSTSIFETPIETRRRFVLPNPSILQITGSIFDTSGVAAFDTNIQRQQFVIRNLAIRMLNMLNTNSVNEWAGKGDLFPSDMFQNFEWLFTNGTDYFNTHASAACYISGISPNLYIYSDLKISVSVQPKVFLTYGYPAFKNKKWNFQTSADGYIVYAGEKFEKLYYEYSPQNIQFSKPKTGFIIKRDAIDTFVETVLRPGFRFHSKEADGLKIEMRNALISKNWEYIKIGILDQKEIDQKIPLDIFPNPEKLYRIHFMLEEGKSALSLHAPEITPIQRGGFYIVETGVFVP